MLTIEATETEIAAGMKRKIEEDEEEVKTEDVKKEKKHTKKEKDGRISTLPGQHYRVSR